jgi:hypothetical protein
VSDPFLYALKTSVLAFEDKHDRFEQRVVVSVLKVVWPGEASVSRAKARHEYMNLAWLNGNVLSAGHAFGAVKLRDPVTLPEWIRLGNRSTELAKAWLDHADAWPGARRRWVVFDCHGDGVGDMVLHHDAGLAAAAPWCMRVTAPVEAKTREPWVDNLFIQSFKDFLPLYAGLFF